MLKLSAILLPFSFFAKANRFIIYVSESDVQPNREILSPPGVDTENDKEQVLSIGKHPSLVKVKQ